MALSFEETVNIIGEVASNLAHPQSIRPPCNPADLNTSRRQLDKEQDDEPLQSARRPNFYCEEITGDDLLPMSAQEFLPGRLSDSFGGWVDAVPFQDVCDRIVRQKMPQIGQRALEAAVTPGSILLSHLHNQAAISLLVFRRPMVRNELPSYFSAINFRCQANKVSGVTMVATRARSRRPSFFAFAANRRRWSSVNVMRRLPFCSLRTRFSSMRYSITCC